MHTMAPFTWVCLSLFQVSKNLVGCKQTSCKKNKKPTYSTSVMYHCSWSAYPWWLWSTMSAQCVRSLIVWTRTAGDNPGAWLGSLPHKGKCLKKVLIATLSSFTKMKDVYKYSSGYDGWSYDSFYFTMDLPYSNLPAIQHLRESVNAGYVQFLVAWELILTLKQPSLHPLPPHKPAG